MGSKHMFGAIGSLTKTPSRAAVMESLEPRQLFSATLYAFDSISSTPEFLKVDTATGQTTDVGTFNSPLQNSIGPIGMFGTNRTSTSGSLYVLEDQQADENAPIVSELETVNPLTGSVATDHGSTGGAYEYLAILNGDNAFDTEYTIDNNFHTTHLVILNGPNGTPETVGDTGINIFGGFTTDGTDLYGITWGSGDGLGEELVKFDPATGAPTIIGPTGNTDYTNSIAFGSDGVLYAYTANTNQISSINTTTGAETVVSTVQGSLFLLDIASVGGDDASSGAGGGTTIGDGGGSTTPTSPLTPAIGKSSLPPSVVSGSTTKGKVSVTVTNSSTTEISGTATIGLFASTTGSIDSTTPEIGSVTVKKLPPLKPGKSTSKTINVPKLTLAANTYTLLTKTTDSSGDVSMSTTGPTLTVAAPFVSLSATVGAVKPTAPKLGKPASFVVTITNAGNVDSTGTLSLAVGLSSDGGTLAQAVSTLTFKTAKIKAGGKPTKITAHFTLPTDLDLLAYYPLVTITQGSSTLTAVGPVFDPTFSAR